MNKSRTWIYLVIFMSRDTKGGQPPPCKRCGVPTKWGRGKYQVYCSRFCSDKRRILPSEEVVVAQATEKKCETCNRFKPFCEFTKLARSHDGMCPKCKQCKRKISKLYYQRNRILLRRRQVEWSRNNPDKARENRRKDLEKHRQKRLASRKAARITRYGITLEQYQDMELSQSYLCAICRQPPEKLNGKTKSLNVDHYHFSGKVRGLLCTRCNTGLGQFLDSPDLLHRAIEYLLATSGVS